MNFLIFPSQILNLLILNLLNEIPEFFRPNFRVKMRIGFENLNFFGACGAEILNLVILNLLNEFPDFSVSNS